MQTITINNLRSWYHGPFCIQRHPNHGRYDLWTTESIARPISHVSVYAAHFPRAEFGADDWREMVSYLWNRNILRVTTHYADQKDPESDCYTPIRT